MARILITGVTGFIGSHLAPILVDDHEVFGLVRPVARRGADLAAGVVEVPGDLADPQSVRYVLRTVEPDVVVHLAAATHVSHSFDHPYLYVTTNIHGTLHVGHGLVDLGLAERSRLVYASTAEVYGIQPPGPVTEDATLAPSSPYANSKSMTDTYLRMMGPVYGLQATLLRSVNSYGRVRDQGFLIEYLVTAMLRGETVYLGMPDSVRTYMHVDDHVAAYRAVIERPGTAGEVFNIAPDETVTNREVCLRLAALLDYDPDRVVFGEYPPGYPNRPAASDQPSIELDASKARRELGWRPRVSLDDGLRRLVEGWRARLGE